MKYYVHFHVFSFEQLEKSQVGYSIDANGNSLVTDEEDTWDANWLVIGYETMCGDPIIIDLNEDGYPISMLMHGMDSWDNGFFLADSMESFLDILKDIGQLLSEAKGKNVIRHKELNTLLHHITSKNKFVDDETWHSLLSPLFEIADEYEKTLETQVKKMKNEGEKIIEIAIQLNLKPQEVYAYMKKRTD